MIGRVFSVNVEIAMVFSKFLSVSRVWQWLIRSICCLGLACVAVVALAKDIDFDSVEITTIPMQGNVYALIGAGANVTVQVGEQGVIVVDTMYGPLAYKVIAAIRELSDRPIQYLINTHAHLGSVGGNIPVGEAGMTVTEGNVRRDSGGLAEDLASRAAVIAHENVVTSMMDQGMAFEMWPTNTFFGDAKDLYFNGEAVRIIHIPNAHTNGDVVVHFRRSDVIATGGIFDTRHFPHIDADQGGSINGLIAAANQIIDATVPAHKMEGGTMLVPAHGRIGDEFDLVVYRDMLTVIRDRIQALVDEGLSLRQVHAANPTAGWNNRWGSDSGPWTTKQFVEVIYNELSRGSD